MALRSIVIWGSAARYAVGRAVPWHTAEEVAPSIQAAQ